jgi:hypothetical protein
MILTGNTIFIGLIADHAPSANLPNAVLVTYPDSGHGSLFQFHDSFTQRAAAFLASDSPFAPFIQLQMKPSVSACATA